MENIYQENGYKDRQDTSDSLAEDYGVSLYDVQAIASLLGPDEDFDGLVVAIEDMVDF